ncbi:Geranylgeranyl pyrophosphate synthase [Archaeoglobus sulfaticallidus PM70-1]|uniref:Geranylgeranyl pyrophosphate synthase n=2 Tax=Archaeoglobus TaxID=2233 RepID=N0BC22_9EURY|nr:Geranylgeranyl pyrophosphate synthase [Archaeoglobus sulfaticallidus PM70-1]
MIDGWEEFKIINRALNELVENSNSIPKIKKALKYIISAGGKRTRPIIVLLSGKMCGGDYNDVLNAAISVELIHTASLAHDDIIDRGVMRRNVRTLHIEYDLPVAILVGDWLISKSVELTSIYGEEIVKEFASVGRMMSEGELLDVYSTREEFSEKDYFKCIESKTASLFAYSAKNACRIVSDDEKAAEELFKYGRNLGMAYQLVDDLIEYLEIYDDKSSEFESRTLPMIYEEKYGFDEAICRTMEFIKKYSMESEKALDYFDHSEEREKLRYMINYMTRNQIRSYIEKNKSKLNTPRVSAYLAF